MYCIFVVLITYALISAGHERIHDAALAENGTYWQLTDVRSYKSTESVFRAIAEVFVIIAVALNLWQEVKELKA